jgi:hypothetical protein
MPRLTTDGSILAISDVHTAPHSRITARKLVESATVRAGSFWRRRPGAPGPEPTPLYLLVENMLREIALGRVGDQGRDALARAEAAGEVHRGVDIGAGAGAGE